jgi:hypothetical protein
VKVCDVGITDTFMLCAVETSSCGMIFLESFIKIGTGFKIILRFCFSNLNGCYVGSADVEEL